MINKGTIIYLLVVNLKKFTLKLIFGVKPRDLCLLECHFGHLIYFVIAIDIIILIGNIHYPAVKDAFMIPTD
jgi:hypothetical protein